MATGMNWIINQLIIYDQIGLLKINTQTVYFEVNKYSNLETQTQHPNLVQNGPNSC